MHIIYNPQAYPMFAVYLPRDRNCLPYMKKTNGIGIKRTAKNANVLDAQAIPSLWYIGSTKSCITIWSAHSCGIQIGLGITSGIAYWEGGCKAGPQEGVSSNCTCRILLKSINQIIQSALKDREEAKAHQSSTYARCNPVDRLAGCPSEHKEATCEEEGPDHHGREPSFGYCFVAICSKTAIIV